MKWYWIVLIIIAVITIGFFVIKIVSNNNNSNKGKSYLELNGYDTPVQTAPILATWSQEIGNWVCPNNKKPFVINCIKAPCPNPTCI